MLENYSYVWVLCRRVVEDCSNMAYEIGLGGVTSDFLGQLLRHDYL